MLSASETLGYLRQSARDALTLRGTDSQGNAFVGGLTPTLPFRKTQREACEAYERFLDDESLPLEEKLSGYFEIPTGIGKTALFVRLLWGAMDAARRNGQPLNTMVVVPTLNLLGQVHRDIRKYAPGLKDQVGLYGGRYRVLGKPVTIITYDSWMSLVEEGKLGSHTTDLLISDEAHRGISARRLSGLYQAFGENCVKLAFTATARFDEERTVAQSHGRRIYFKSLMDAVLDDELAAYIHTQLFVIRALPSDQGASVNRKALRRAAWNKRVIKIFSKGRDHITGECISDNPAAFFVADTRHADRLEALLNDDANLSEKARLNGCKAVAVSVHSNLSPKQQAMRVRDFILGKYMAVIGDEKFKEGFDHPALKTIVDYPRGSLVDKAQIMGRGARKFWNARKGRFEGMTFIDTVVYVGSSDPKLNMLFRDISVKRAVYASSVIDGNAVVSGRQRPSRAAPSGSGSGEAPIANETDVEEYVETESIRTIQADIAKMQKDGRIPYTEQMRLYLLAEQERTGLGASRIYSKLSDRQRASIDFKNISNLYVAYGVATADRAAWEAILACYAAQPNKSNVRIDLTEEMRRHLQSESDRTKVGYQRVLRHLPGTWRERFPKHKLRGWFQDRRIGSVNLEEWTLIKETYASLPSLEQRGLKGRPVISQPQLAAESSLPATDLQSADHLPKQKSKTSHASADVPAPNPDSFQTIRAASPRTPLGVTSAMRGQLKAEMARTNIGYHRIHQRLPSDISSTLTASRIKKLASDEKLKSVAREEWDALLAAYRAIATQAENTRKIPFTDDMRAKMLVEQERTKLGYKQIQKRLAESWRKLIPDHKIRNWFDPRLAPATVIEAEFNAVVDAYAAQPDSTRKSRFVSRPSQS